MIWLLAAAGIFFPPTGKTLVGDPPETGVFFAAGPSSPFTLPAGAYVIPNTVNTIIHVDAADLHGGTANAGPAWTVNSGSVPYDAGALPRANVGPFTGTAYYKQTSSILNTTQPFTCAMVSYVTTTSSIQVLTANPPGSTAKGLFEQDDAEWEYMTEVSGANTAVLGINVTIYGVNSAGKAVIQANGGTIVSTTTAITVGTTGESTLGSFTTSGDQFLGLIYEYECSTDNPTSTFVTALYAAIEKNL